VAAFQSVSSGGAAEPATDTSDARGMVRTAWRLGDVPGRQQLAITVPDVAAAPAVSAEADPLPANTRVELVGRDLVGQVGDTIREPLLVRVADSLGRALADLPVAWTALEGGALVGQAARTDSLGEARAAWKLGAKAGRQRARVQVGNARTLAPVTAMAEARPGPATAVVAISGDRQVGSVGRALPQPVVLRAMDANGNPIAGAILRLPPPPGRPGDSVVVTDSSGRARVAWTLGQSAGLQRLTLRLSGDTAEAEVTAVARPGKAAKIGFVGAPETGTGGRALSKPLVVQVTDGYGNPLGGQTVIFKASSGSVAPARGLTDAAGRASVRWTLGARAKRPELTASVSGTKITRTLTLTARPSP
jgi:hypothetical protein